MYGDFEDLETGEIHKAKSGKGDEAEVLGLGATFLHHFFIFVCGPSVAFVCVFVYAYHKQGDEEEEEEEEAPKLVKIDDDEAQKNKRLEKKKRLKERFNAEYDDDATYFDDLKEEMQKQAEVRGHSCNMTCIHPNLTFKHHLII